MHKLHVISLLLLGASGSIYASATQYTSVGSLDAPQDPWIKEICAEEIVKGLRPVRGDLDSVVASFKAGLRTSAVDVTCYFGKNVAGDLSVVSDQLSDCDLKFLAIHVACKKSLERLSLLPESPLFSRLVALRLSDLNIGYIVPGAFNNMQALRKLDLSNNCLTLFPVLEGLEKLEELDIRHQRCACDNGCNEKASRCPLPLLDASGVGYLIEHGALEKLQCTPHSDGALTARIRKSEPVYADVIVRGYSERRLASYTDALYTVRCEGKDTPFGIVVKHSNELPKNPDVFTRLEPRASAADVPPVPKTQEAAHADAGPADSEHSEN